MTTRPLALPLATQAATGAAFAPQWQANFTCGVAPADFSGIALRLDGNHGLLVEAGSTNACTYSNDLSVWNLNAGASLNQTTTAPDGSTAYSIVFDAGSWASGIYRGAAGLTTGAACTYSGYFKNLSGDPTVYFGSDSGVWGSGGPMALNFNSATGAENGWESAVTAHSVQAVGNGWYRASVTATLASGTTPSVVVYHGTGAAAETAVWGLQAEVGGFATSMIPTTANPVTRSADGIVLSRLTPLGFNPAEGTLFIEAVLEGIGSTQPLIQIDNSDVGQVLSLGQSGGYLVAKGVASGTTVLNAQIADTVSAFTPYKLALGYKNGSLSACANGGSVSTASAAAPINLSTLRMGNDGQSHFAGGWLRKAAYYPYKLPDADLRNLTV